MNHRVSMKNYSPLTILTQQISHGLSMFLFGFRSQEAIYDKPLCLIHSNKSGSVTCEEIVWFKCFSVSINLLGSSNL